MAGKMVHVEFPTKDSAASQEFWSGLFGWQFQQFGDGDYHVTQIDETSGAAISGGDDTVRLYFDVDDIDAALAKVRELGGEAGEKQSVPGMGFWAPCSDSQGAPFGVWQSAQSAA